MIGLLTGQVSFIKTDRLILSVGGVGYIVFVPPQFLQHVQIGKQLTLYTYTHVREDNLSLFGFATSSELELFEMLLSVSGVGPKTAVVIVDQGVVSVKQAVIRADVEFFRTIPRLGTKNSQKIIIELKSKIGSEKDINLQTDDTNQTQEVVDALGAMGFSRQEVVSTLKQISSDAKTIEDKIKHVLKFLGRNPR